MELPDRFAQPVFPGETLQIDMWRDGPPILLNVGVIGRDGPAWTNTVVEPAAG